MKGAIQEHEVHQQFAGANSDVSSLSDLHKTPFFERCSSIAKQEGFSRQALVSKFETFDFERTGKIKIHHLVNVMKHNYGNLFSDDELKNLQFDLECLSNDETVDYKEFVSVAFRTGKVDEKEDELMSHVKGSLSD